MKKVLTLILCLAIGMIMLCSCGEDKVYEQTGRLGYEIPADWTCRTVTPAPSTMKQYDYGDYTVMVGSVSYFFYEDPLKEALDYAIGGAEGAGASYENQIIDCTVNEMPAKEVAVNDGGGFSGMFTAIETEAGVYVAATTTEDPELRDDVEKLHSALKDTIIFSDADDGEVYAKNVLQFADYIASVPAGEKYMIYSPWWTSRETTQSGVTGYEFDSDTVSLKIVPVEPAELTEELIHETLGKIYDGSSAPAAACTLSGRTEMDCPVGSAVYYVLDLHFGDDKSNTVKASAVFILNKEGQAVCCLSNTSDSDLTYDYSVMVSTMQLAAPVYEQVDMLFSLAVEYTGDNSAVSTLTGAVGFGKYGDYSIALKTEKEPYGLIINYKTDVKDYDFQREAVMMLGLISNLDHIEIKDADSDIVRYDTNVTKSLLMYDVKLMAIDKAKLECYYLETLY